MWRKGYIVGHTVIQYSLHDKAFSPHSGIEKVGMLEGVYERRRRSKVGFGYMI